MNLTLTRRDIFALAFMLQQIHLFNDKQIAMCEFRDFAIKTADLLSEGLDHYPEGIFTDDPEADNQETD